MKALLLEDVGRLTLADVPNPEIQEGELLITTAVSTICTSDLNDIAENPFEAELPLVLGHEDAGTVARLASRLDLEKVVVAGYHDFRLEHEHMAVPVNTRHVDDPVATLLTANEGLPYNAVIVAAGSKRAVREGIRCLRWRGHLVIFATLVGEMPVDLFTVQIHELEIVGACNDHDRFDEAVSTQQRESADHT